MYRVPTRTYSTLACRDTVVIYNGETNVVQEELSLFMTVATIKDTVVNLYANPEASCLVGLLIVQDDGWGGTTLG